MQGFLEDSSYHVWCLSSIPYSSQWKPGHVCFWIWIILNWRVSVRSLQLAYCHASISPYTVRTSVFHEETGVLNSWSYKVPQKVKNTRISQKQKLKVSAVEDIKYTLFCSVSSGVTMFEKKKKRNLGCITEALNAVFCTELSTGAVDFYLRCT